MGRYVCISILLYVTVGAGCLPHSQPATESHESETCRLNAFKVPASEVVRRHAEIEQMCCLRPEIRAVCALSRHVAAKQARRTAEADAAWTSAEELFKFHGVRARTLDYLTATTPEGVVSDGLYARICVNALRDKGRRGLLTQRDQQLCIQLLVWQPGWPAGAKHLRPAGNDTDLRDVWPYYAGAVLQALGNSQDPHVLTRLSEQVHDEELTSRAMGALAADVQGILQRLAELKQTDQSAELQAVVTERLTDKLVWQPIGVQWQLDGGSGRGEHESFYHVCWPALYADYSVWTDGTPTKPLTAAQQRRLEEFEALPEEERVKAATEAFLSRVSRVSKTRVAVEECAPEAGCCESPRAAAQATAPSSQPRHRPADRAFLETEYGRTKKKK
jgi:hypothetical protein